MPLYVTTALIKFQNWRKKFLINFSEWRIRECTEYRKNDVRWKVRFYFLEILLQKVNISHSQSQHNLYNLTGFVLARHGCYYTIISCREETLRNPPWLSVSIFFSMVFFVQIIISNMFADAALWSWQRDAIWTLTKA